MPWDSILYEKIDNIVKITMNRPESHNAQDYHMIDELDEAFTQAELDEDVRVIILAGAGRSFSSGHDMSSRARPSSAPDMEISLEGLEGRMWRERRIYFERCLKIRNLSKPTIAQVHGYCIGAGLMLAAMCDIIIASEDASFQDPVLRMGFSAAELLVEPWEFGPRKAKEFLWTGDSFDAREACRLGLVNRVVPRERLDEEVMGLAGRIAITPPIVVSLTKRDINETMDLMGQMRSWEYHFLIHQIAHNTEEAKRYTEEITAAMAKGELKSFFEKRDRTYEDK